MNYEETRGTPLSAHLETYAGLPIFSDKYSYRTDKYSS